MPGRWLTTAAGAWAGPARSTPWRTCAATGRSMTAGPRAGRPAGDMRTCCRTSGAASTPTDATRAARHGRPGLVAPVPRAGPASGAVRVRRRPGTRRAARSPMTSAGSGKKARAWVDLAIARWQRVSPDSAYLPARPAPPETSIVRACLPGHRLARAARPVHRGSATSPAAHRPQAHTGGGGDRVRGRDRLPAAAAAVGDRPGRAVCAPWASTRSPICPGSGRTCRTTPSSWRATRYPGPLPRSRYNHGEMYAALRSGLAGACPDLHLFPILLPVAPAGYPAPPAGFALVASVVRPGQPRHAAAGIGGPSGGTADRPRFPAGAGRRGPAGSRPGNHPHGRRHRRVLARARLPGRTWAQAPPPAPGCGTSSAGPSAATTTRRAPAGWARHQRLRRRGPGCASAAWPGCGSRTRRPCRSSRTPTRTRRAGHRGRPQQSRPGDSIHRGTTRIPREKQIPARTDH